MTSTNPAPAQSPVPQTPQPIKPTKHEDTRRTSGMAITGLVLGITGLVLSFIPIVNNFAFVLAIVGAIFAVIGIIKGGPKGKKKGRVMSIIAAVLCVLACVITLVMQQSVSDALDKAQHDVNQKMGVSTLSDQGDGNKPKIESVELQATATGKGNVMWDDGAGSSNSQDFDKTWTKKVDPKDAKGMLSLYVTGDMTSDSDDQKMSCTILVNGKQKQHKEASGSAGSADCTIDFDN